MPIFKKGCSVEKVKIAVLSLAVFMMIAAAGAPDLYPSAADERDEIQKTWRLLARDLAYWDKDRTSVRPVTCSPKYQPPAEQCFNAEALVHATDRDPLDILLRRSKALAADIAAERVKAALADGDGFSAGDSFSSLVASLDTLADKAAATDISDEDARYMVFAKTMRIRRRIAFAVLKPAEAAPPGGPSFN